MTIAEPTATIEIKAPSEHMDEDGFVSLWNIAVSSCDGNVEQARALAANLLGFLCKKNCDFVVVSTTDAEYLDAWFERDNKLLYDWKPESEMVDVMAQHAEVPGAQFASFLELEKFKQTTKYSPRRVDRVQWFTETWNVG